MSAERKTRTVVRMLMAWNDEKEQRWLEEQERSGWHLSRRQVNRETHIARPGVSTGFQAQLPGQYRRQGTTGSQQDTPEK